MLAGTLRAANVHFGKVLDFKSVRNAKGFHEAPSVLYMHEDLLVESGGCWHEPPTHPEWRSLHKSVRDLFLESRRSEALWAFKDPRTILVVEGWREVMPDLEFAGIFRHPAEVAMSIHDRNAFDLEKCFGIWCAYNEKLLALRQSTSFPIIEFLSDRAKMMPAFERLFKALGINMTDEAYGFFDTGLKHFDKPEIEVPSRAKEIYSELQRFAI